MKMRNKKNKNSIGWFIISCFLIFVTSITYPLQAQGDFDRYLANLPAKDAQQAQTPQHMILLTASEEAERAKAEAQKKKEEEAKRIEAERKAKAAEEARKLEKARKAAEAEEARKLEEARKAAEEARKLEAARKVAEEKLKREAARKAAEEARKLEEARKAAEEARKLEAARKAAEEKLKREAAKKKAAESKAAKKWIKSWGGKAKKAVKKDKPSEKKKRVASLKDGAVPYHERFFNSAQYAKWKAIYVGGQISSSSVDGDRAVSIGGIVGKNWQDKTFVYGVEGELVGLNNDDTEAVSGGTLSVNSDWMASIRVRAGYLLSPDTLLYATAGVAWANFDTELSGISGSTSSSETMAGFVIGAGVEHHFSDDWAARLEYAYTDFGSRTVRNGTQVANLDPEIHAIKLAFVYRF